MIWLRVFSLASLFLAYSSLGVVAQTTNPPAPTYTPPPGSPGFYHGQSSAAVTFDNLSAFVDNKRLFVFSGEFHPWRIPAGKAAWRDVFQKMKAAGFNAASLYLHWGLSEGKPGTLDFNFFRSHTDAYQVAKEVGIFIIVRPGPYINAETLAGGMPGWLTNVPAQARTNATGYLNAWTPYMTATARAAAPFQYPNGPIISFQVENEFFPQSDPLKAANMVQLEDVIRKNGIDKVPLTHNDVGILGDWVNGTGMVDLYQWDSYPNGFLCSNPSAWSEVNANQNSQHLRTDPLEVWATAEFQGGSFDPWFGSGYSECFDLINEQFANVFYKNNIAGGVRWQNFYMTFGGTNWGNLAEPTVYTSYDYGAPIKEDRTLSPKYDEIKLQAHFTHASTDLYTSRVISSGTNFTTNTNVFTTRLQGDSGTNFYVTRQTTNKNTAIQNFSMTVNVGSTSIVIPQFGGQITLAGRESKIIPTNYKFGSSILQYSTGEIMTWTTIDGVDHIVLYVLPGQSIEAVFSNPAAATPAVRGSTSINARKSGNSVVVTGSPTGLTVIRFAKTVVLAADKRTAATFWNPKLIQNGRSTFDTAPTIPSVIAIGPYLVRNATIDGSTLKLFGDINTTTTIQFIAPSSVKRLSWNDQNVAITTSSAGLNSAVLKFTLTKNDFSLPNLEKSSWQCLDSLPEVKQGFDDSSWIIANKTITARPYKPFAGKFVVYADEYGFHQGNTLYRGHFTGNASSIWLSVQGGFNFGYSVWINTVFLGSSQGTNQYTTLLDNTNVTWTFPAHSLSTGSNVVTVVFDQTGLEEDFTGEETFKTPRGIRGYQLNGGGDINQWKVIGNLGGESAPDKVRGPYNEGGLFVERLGAHLPGFSTRGWSSGASCNPLKGRTAAGITAYRTTFRLNMPRKVDIPLALKFTLDPNVNYRTLIYINGWQFGRVLNGVQFGPQDTFPLPQGILNHNGENTLLVTIWALDATGAKMAQLQLISTALIQSSREFVPGGVVTSPTFQQVRG